MPNTTSHSLPRRRNVQQDEEEQLELNRKLGGRVSHDPQAYILCFLSAGACVLCRVGSLDKIGGGQMMETTSPTAMNRKSSTVLRFKNTDISASLCKNMWSANFLSI